MISPLRFAISTRRSPDLLEYATLPRGAKILPRPVTLPEKCKKPRKKLKKGV